VSPRAFSAEQTVDPSVSTPANCCGQGVRDSTPFAPSPIPDLFLPLIAKQTGLDNGGEVVAVFFSSKLPPSQSRRWRFAGLYFDPRPDPCYHRSPRQVDRGGGGPPCPGSLSSPGGESSRRRMVRALIPTWLTRRGYVCRRRLLGFQGPRRLGGRESLFFPPFQAAIAPPSSLFYASCLEPALRVDTDSQIKTSSFFSIPALLPFYIFVAGFSLLETSSPMCRATFHVALGFSLVPSRPPILPQSSSFTPRRRVPPKRPRPEILPSYDLL